MKKIAADVASLSEVSDIQVVGMHWGTEYQFAPDDRQRELAQWLSDQGVDVIIGTHPHVLQPIQMITGEKGNETLVFYSLGNFVSAQDVNSRMLGAMAKWNMIYDPQDGHVAIEDVRVEPTVMFFDAAGKNVQVYPLSQYDDETASRHLLSLQGEDMSVSFSMTCARRSWANGWKTRSDEMAERKVIAYNRKASHDYFWRTAMKPALN